MNMHSLIASRSQRRTASARWNSCSRMHYTVDEIADRLKTHELELVLHNLPAGNWEAGERGIACHPDRVSEFQHGVGEAIRYAKALKVKQLNCLVGIVPPGVHREKAQETLIEQRIFRSGSCEGSLFPGHLSMVSTHYYIFGNGRKAEKDPAATRARFLSPEDSAIYEKAYASTARLLAAQGVPYRIDEMNSCWSGGAKGASDTYASTLWALDWTHWWAAHHIGGMNYHTGERVGMNSGFQAPNYASFLRLPNRGGFAMRPIAYSHLAFTQGAQGMPAPAKIEKLPESNLTAYAYRQSNGGYTVTLINKSYGEEANTASVSVKLPADAKMGKWQKLSLLQKNGDIAAADGITFGGESVDPQGKWSGNWETVPGAGGNAIVVRVPAASATILKFVPAG